MKFFLKMVLACCLLSLTARTSTGQTQSMCPQVERPSIYVSLMQARTRCPLSAAIQIKRIQTLADGTHVQTRSKALVYRDSLGRIRYETYNPTDIEPNMIEIVDPVDGFGYFLFPQKPAVSVRHKLSEPGADAAVGAQGQHASAPPSRSPPAQDLEPKIAVEQLGSQQLEGLLVTGTRTTWTLPVGAQGNDRPITTVSEIWISSEIGITLLERKSDPRQGDLERQMTNLEQTEPEAALFQVPANYTLSDQ